MLVLLLAALAAAPVPSIYKSEAPPEAPWSTGMAALGKKLFFEPRLSADGKLSCAGCHQPSLAFTDGRPTAQGVGGKTGDRNTPTVLNRALGKVQFWDGRAATLEVQALGPIENPKEMAMPLSKALAMLQADPAYLADFKRVFGSAPTQENLAKAIAAWERSVYSVDAPFDRFVSGDPKALSAAAQRGLKLFGDKAKCSTCHVGTNFSDEQFHVLGLGSDDGHMKVSKKPQDKGSFKTPTLREIARTGPYMHDGSIGTLAEVIDYYDRGGEPVANLDPKMLKLGLTKEEKADLLVFLEALTGEVRDFEGRVMGGGK